MDYQQFLKDNRTRVNRALNKAVLACVLAGIGIFTGTALHLWHNISYSSAIIQTLLILAISIVMFLVNKKYSHTYIPSVLGLISLDLILGYSANVHIGIYLTYFFVPLLAIAFCDKVFYLIICAMNYVAMFLSVLNISDYYGSNHLHYYTADNPGLKWFISHMTGYTLEYICMTIAGWFICKHITKHMQALYDYQSKASRQFRVMESATNIFEQIYYINDMTNTYVANHKNEFNFINREQIEESIKLLEQNITPTDEERFKDFVDFDSLGQRLKNRNSIEDTFYSMKTGYFSAMFISVSEDKAENAGEYIFCTRDVNEEKARERSLNEMARRDQPTSLLNRRAYEEDFTTCENAQNRDLAIVVVDINGLKTANDSLGHFAGDELILAAAQLLNKYFEDLGTVYRVGGDEFHIIVRQEPTSLIEERIQSLKEEAGNWEGKMVKTLSLAVGLASAKENPELDLKKTQKLADQRMYQDKELYYAENPGLERRNQ